MTTIVNNPPSSDNSGGPMGWIIGLILIIVIAYLVVVYGVPAISRMGGTPQINIPGKIDVNVNQTK